LHAAAADPSGQAAEVLLAHGAAVDLWDEDGDTALHAMARQGNAAAVAALCAHGADLQARNESGRTPLAEAEAERDKARGHAAEEVRRREQVVALLQPGGACARSAPPATGERPAPR
jgi:ankyrin repeat protein